MTRASATPHFSLDANLSGTATHASYSVYPSRSARRVHARARRKPSFLTHFLVRALCSILLVVTDFIITSETLSSILNTADIKDMQRLGTDSLAPLSPLLVAFGSFCLMLVQHGYSADDLLQPGTMVKHSFKAWLLTLIASLSIVYAAGLPIPAATLLTTLCLAFAFTLAARLLMAALTAIRPLHASISIPTLVVGSPDEIQHALRALSKHSIYYPVAFCSIEFAGEHGRHNTAAPLSNSSSASATLPNLPSLAYSSIMPRQAAQAHIDAMYICNSLTLQTPTFRTLALRVEAAGLHLIIPTEPLSLFTSQQRISTDAPHTLASLSLRQYSMGSRFLKRLLDIVMAFVGIILTSPVMLITALAIKIEDGGKIFYIQKRIGKNNVPFKMIKFRSMVSNADSYKSSLIDVCDSSNDILFKMKNDPRVTRVGSFTRRYSIDEIPQFFNVLNGTMSIVGPRPPLPEEAREFDEIYSMRQTVRPGITGLWQVSGRSDLSADQARRLDTAYLQDWSLTTDFTIILRTLGAVFQHRGAY